MIAILHALVDILLFSALLLGTRILNELNNWSEDVEKRLSRLEAREQADSREVNYLMERAELQSER